MAKNMLPGDNWIPGVILKQLGPVSFLVDVGEGRTLKRHLDHKVRDLPDPVSDLVPEEVPIRGAVLEPVVVEPNLNTPIPVISQTGRISLCYRIQVHHQLYLVPHRTGLCNLLSLPHIPTLLYVDLLVHGNLRII